MTEAVGVALAAALLGGAWRRWFGSSGNSRVMITCVGYLLFLIISLYATQVWWQGFMIAAMLSCGFAFGHTYKPWHPLILRYGVVTWAIALVLVLLGHPITWAVYAPFGMFAPLGYILGERLRLTCWTCLGEVWLGAIIVGPLPLLRIL